jgi:hypothetical protein
MEVGRRALTCGLVVLLVAAVGLLVGCESPRTSASHRRVQSLPVTQRAAVHGAYVTLRRTIPAGYGGPRARQPTSSREPA